MKCGILGGVFDVAKRLGTLLFLFFVPGQLPEVRSQQWIIIWGKIILGSSKSIYYLLLHFPVARIMVFHLYSFAVHLMMPDKVVDVLFCQKGLFGWYRSSQVWNTIRTSIIVELPIFELKSILLGLMILLALFLLQGSQISLTLDCNSVWEPNVYQLLAVGFFSLLIKVVVTYKKIITLDRYMGLRLG